MGNCEKMWRTLLRVISVNFNGIWVVIPARTCNVSIFIDWSLIPIELEEVVAEDYRFHAKCNFGCDYIEDIVFSDFEVS